MSGRRRLDTRPEDDRFIAVARFESEKAAMANGARPEQDAWWAATSKLLDGEATFRDSTDVEVDMTGRRQVGGVAGADGGDEQAEQPNG